MLAGRLATLAEGLGKRAACTAGMAAAVGTAAAVTTQTLGLRMAEVASNTSPTTSGGGGTSCHTDPGSGWDWDRYIDLVNGSGGGGSIPIGAIADGDKSGWFEADVTSDRYGVTKTCSGPVNGVANKGHLYLTAVCHLEHEGRSGDFQITWSAEESGTNVIGKVVVDAYSDAFEGTVKGDGSVDAYLTGAHDLAGDVGVISYEADLAVDP